MPLDPFERRHLEDTLALNRKIGRILDQTSTDIAKRFTTVKGQRFASALEQNIEVMREQLRNGIEGGVRQQWLLGNVAVNAKLDGYLTGVNVAPALAQSWRSPSLPALAAFLGRTEQGMRLSDRVWALSGRAKGEVEDLLASGVTAGKDARATARDLRRYLGGKPIPYQGVLIKGSNIEFQSIRLAATETNMAFRVSEWKQNSQLPFVTGVRIHLSAAHPRPDICDALQGEYPKGFMFEGWHPLCYGRDCEIYTSEGWRLFSDLTGDERVLTLDPETKGLEWGRIVTRVAYSYSGKMYRFHNRSFDMMVTPDHEMVCWNELNGDLVKIPAAHLEPRNDLFMLVALNPMAVNVQFHKEAVDYDGIVYDVEADRNHIIYVRRNGKCAWGSNCICYAMWDRVPKQEFTRYLETGYQDFARNATTAIPERARDYLAANRERFAGYKTKPYWLAHNFNAAGAFTGAKGLPFPTVVAPVGALPVQLPVPRAQLGVTAEAPGWAPAKTVAEAEAWAERNALDPTEVARVRAWNANPTHEQIKFMSYRGLSVDSANEINQTLAGLMDRGVPRLKRIVARPIRKQNWAMRMSTSGDFEINATYAKTPAGVRATIREAEALRERLRPQIEFLESKAATLTLRQQAQLKAGKEQLRFKREFVGDSLRDQVYHEVGGHHFDRVGWSASGMSQPKWNTLINEATREAASEQYKYSISSYAFESIFNQRAEVFAECAALYLRDEIADLPPKMLAFLRRMYR